eukprot:TRINITY_DN13367_c0_g1_i5.p1 TRINITY_DN13367_c0_g1~~TRINITY_DN13367_c0_g1_i5.p1  ORF type:complete len:800 (+),score=281.54 TRINITY_DN13367_c0_g1_i5:116-2401(+)
MPAGSAGATDEEAAVIRKLHSFCTWHLPDEVDRVPAIVREHSGRLDQLMAGLRSRYPDWDWGHDPGPLETGRGSLDTPAAAPLVAVQSSTLPTPPQSPAISAEKVRNLPETADQFRKLCEDEDVSPEQGLDLDTVARILGLQCGDAPASDPVSPAVAAGLAVAAVCSRQPSEEPSDHPFDAAAASDAINTAVPEGGPADEGAVRAALGSIRDAGDWGALVAHDAAAGRDFRRRLEEEMRPRALRELRALVGARGVLWPAAEEDGDAANTVDHSDGTVRQPESVVFASAADMDSTAAAIAAAGSAALQPRAGDWLADTPGEESRATTAVASAELAARMPEAVAAEGTWKNDSEKRSCEIYFNGVVHVYRSGDQQGVLVRGSDAPQPPLRGFSADLHADLGEGAEVWVRRGSPRNPAVLLELRKEPSGLGLFKLTSERGSSQQTLLVVPTLTEMSSTVASAVPSLQQTRPAPQTPVKARRRSRMSRADSGWGHSSTKTASVLRLQPPELADTLTYATDDSGRCSADTDQLIDEVAELRRRLSEERHRNAELLAAIRGGQDKLTIERRRLSSQLRRQRRVNDTLESELHRDPAASETLREPTGPFEPAQPSEPRSATSPPFSPAPVPPVDGVADVVGGVTPPRRVPPSRLPASPASPQRRPVRHIRSPPRPPDDASQAAPASPPQLSSPTEPARVFAVPKAAVRRPSARPRIPRSPAWRELQRPPRRPPKDVQVFVGSPKPVYSPTWLEDVLQQSPDRSRGDPV